MYEYKVLTQKDRFFNGKFNPELLEQAINAYAQQGWRVITSATGEIATGLGNREEIVIILERKKEEKKESEHKKEEPNKDFKNPNDIVLPRI